MGGTVNNQAAAKRVLDVMTPAPITVTPDATGVQLLALLDRHDFDALPVVDHAGVLCGIVTKLEVLKLIRPAPDMELADSRTLKGTPVEQIMRRGVVAVSPEDSVLKAADLLLEMHFRTLPVVRQERAGSVVVGVVTLGDLLGYFRSEMVAREGALSAS
jgi:CBS-domain-containing membrane protein